MRVTAYCMFINYRSWSTIGLVFFSRDARLEALRDLVEDEGDDVPEDADENDLVELIGLHEHEVHLFEGETTATNSH